MRSRLIGGLAAAVLIATTLTVGSAASAGTLPRPPVGSRAAARAATGPHPCIDWTSIYDPGTSTFQEVQVPGPGGPFQGYLVIPVNHPAKFVGGAVLLHGAGGDACSLWWAARLLAQNGFVALTLHYEAPTEGGGYEAAAEDAGRAGLAYMATLSNITPHRLALVGHSLGSSAAAGIQSDLSTTMATARKTVSTVVALDNLRGHTTQDPGGGTHCSNHPRDKVNARVPAIGIGSMVVCPNHPTWGSKRTGLNRWHAAGIPTMEAVLNNSTHGFFTGGRWDTGATHQQHLTQMRRAGYYMVAWLRRWLLNDKSQDARLLSQHPLGVAIAKTLLNDKTFRISAPTKGHPHRTVLAGKSRVRSSAYLPGRTCEDLRHCKP